MLKLFLFFLLKVAFAEVPAVHPTNFDQIEVDVLKQKYTEALGALKDVPAGEQRGKRYSDLVEKAGVGYLRAERENLSNAERLAEDLPKTFLLLEKSEAFQKERDSISEAGFSECFEKSEDKTECALRLHSRLEKEPGRTDFLIWAAGKLYSEKNPDLAFKTLILGTNSKMKKKVCQSDTATGLTVMELKNSTQDAGSMVLAKDKCWKDFQGKLAKEVANQKDEVFLKNTCRLFHEKRISHAKCKKLNH